MCIAKKQIGKNVIIRTYSAGVHFGQLEQVESAADGYDVELVNTRRIYSWAGAFTLSEIATNGPSSDGTKLSVPVPSNYFRAIEIIEMTENGFKNLNKIPAFQP